MKEEDHLRYLTRLQKIAAREGIPLDDLIRKIQLGKLTLEFWRKAREKKLPDEVLRADIARLLEIKEAPP